MNWQNSTLSELTFAAWLRTGVAFVATGVAARRLLQGDLPEWQLRTLGVVLAACAVMCFGAGEWRDWRLRLSLPQPDLRLLPWVLTFGLSLLLMVLSVLDGLSILLA